jgi:hypothetical protein
MILILLVLAKRMRAVKIFKTTPQQGDYVVAWQGQPDIEIRKQPLLARFLNAWRDGWLSYALVLRFLKLTQSDALIDAWQNRRYSKKHQPELFRQSDPP